MGLRSAFQKAAKTIVTAFGDVSVVCDYVIDLGQIRNPITKIVTQSVSTYSNKNFIFTMFSISEREADQTILPTDIKALISSIELGVKPSQNTTVTVVSTTDRTVRAGDVYNVVNWKTDPAEALYTLHLRTSA